MPELSQPTADVGRHETLVDSARSVSALIESDAAKAEAQNRLTDAVIAAIRDANLYALLVPSCLGGHEADLPVALQVCQELARADGSAGWCFMAQMCWNSAAGAYLGDSAIAEIFAKGPNVIVAGQGMPNGTAEIVDGGHIVNGHWRYGSGIAHADFIQCGCVLTKNGKPLRKTSGAPQIRLCATRPENVQVVENWDVMGLRATGSHDYLIKDLFVPDDFGYDTDETRPRRGGGIYRLGLKNTTALGHTAFALGVCRRALGELRELVLAKRSSAYGCIGHVPAFQKDYAMADLQLRGLEALALDSWGAVQEVIQDGREPGMATIAVIRAQTRHVHEVAADVISFAYKMAGGAALRASALQRCFRDIHAGTQHVLVSHQIASAAGKVLLGMHEPTEHWGMLSLET
jgi:alkylation response protein AidB-like acyl-CoA dehydrogenase